MKVKMQLPNSEVEKKNRSKLIILNLNAQREMRNKH
jgi:hypothetical protein